MQPKKNWPKKFHQNTLYYYTTEKYTIILSLFLPLGSKVTGLDTIESLDRFQEPPLSGPFCDLIWSDPLLEEILGKRLSDKEYQEVREGLSLKHSFLYLCSHTSICYYDNSHISYSFPKNNIYLTDIVSLYICKSLYLYFFVSFLSSSRSTTYPTPRGAAPVSMVTWPLPLSSTSLISWG